MPLPVPMTLYYFKSKDTVNRAIELYSDFKFSRGKPIGQAIALTLSALRTEGYNMQKMSEDEFNAAYPLAKKAPRTDLNTNHVSVPPEIQKKFEQPTTPALFDLDSI